MNCERSVADLLRLLACYLCAQLRVIVHFHADRGCNLGEQIRRLLLFLSEEWVEETGVADVVTEFAMFQKHVHALPQGVVENLDHFLMDEWIGCKRFNSVGAFRTGKSEGQGSSRLRKVESGADLIVSFRRTESHHDIFGMKNRFQPGPEEHGKIECRKCALADDHWMNKFHGDMLGIGGVGTAPEGKQTSSVEKALGHRLAGFRQAGRFAGKEFFDDTVAHQQALFHLGQLSR